MRIKPLKASDMLLISYPDEANNHFSKWLIRKVEWENLRRLLSEISVIKEDIPSLYPNNLHCLKYHMDKATNHISKSTAAFVEKFGNEAGIQIIAFKCIPPKYTVVFP